MIHVNQQQNYSHSGRARPVATAVRRRKAKAANPEPESKDKPEQPNWERVELGQIPRRKTSWGGEGGPLVIPPGRKHISGTKRCETCGRMVKVDRKFPRKGSCKCLYYKRTTTFIDVLQDEFLLKQWGNRNVAWGVAQRPDLQLLAASCKRPSEIESGSEDYKELNNVVAEAQREAGDKIKATIGTSLHKLTHQMDRGETLGYVPERWEDDLKVYDEHIKILGIEWVSIESFRVFDQWVKENCDHKAIRYGGNCECMGIAGTVDRIGWYRGRLRIFDIKTGSDFNKLGHAMQLTMYATMTPYLFPGDVRTTDVDQIDLDVGYIIKLPEGKAHCELEPLDLRKGAQACKAAKLVWEMRDMDVTVERDIYGEVTEMAGRAGSLKECRMLWEAAKENGNLDARLKSVLLKRVDELKDKGIDK